MCLCVSKNVFEKKYVLKESYFLAATLIAAFMRV